MMISHLEWDSKFLGMKTGKMDCMKPYSCDDILKNLKNSKDFDLVYVFSDEKLSQADTPSTLKLVDEKIRYRIYPGEPGMMKPESSLFSLSIFNEEKPTIEMESLAFQSGEFSRFKMDTSFEPSVFYRLYKEWITNSVSKAIADATIVTRIDDKIVGLLTLKFEKAHSRIGLFAVDERFRGIGMGNALMNYCCRMTHEKGLDTIFVDTQAANQTACSFYERFGFQLYCRTFIYHYWKKDYDSLQ